MKPFVPHRLPRNDFDWAALVPLIGDAHGALKGYDTLLQVLVNPQILLSPLEVREAVLSSRIEGTQASLEEVLEYEADPREVPGARLHDIQEILNYRRAMDGAIEELKQRPLSLNLIKSAHFMLLDSVRGRDKARGEFRRDQVYIAPPGTPVERATYIPPPWTEILSMLDNLEKYFHIRDTDRIVQAGLIHAQFELIHPFLDGNGRVGRMLIPLFLFASNTISSPTFYISSYLEAHRDEYYARLEALSRSGDFQGWAAFFLHAVARQAEEDTAKARQILKLYDHMKVVLARVTRSQYAIRALDALFIFPIFSTPQFVERGGVPRASAARMLADLARDGVLRVVRPGKGKRAAITRSPSCWTLSTQARKLSREFPVSRDGGSGCVSSARQNGGFVSRNAISETNPAERLMRGTYPDTVAYGNVVALDLGGSSLEAHL